MNANLMTTPSLGEPVNYEPGETIRDAALAALRATGYRLLGNLGCEVEDGRVILTGSVPSFYLKQVAQSALRSLGNGITNLIEVQDVNHASDHRT